MKSRLRETGETLKESVETAGSIAGAAKRPIPRTMAELEKEVGQYKLPARFAVLGLSKSIEAMGMKKLDPEEVESCTLAGAAKIYEMGGVLSADFLIVMCLLGVFLPRCMDAWQTYQKKKSINTPAGIDKLRQDAANKPSDEMKGAMP